jgi:hypothetical protein
VAPEHLDGVLPGAVGRQVEQNQPTRRPTHHRLDLVVLVGVGIIPSHLDTTRRMLLQQCFEQLGSLPPALAATEQDHRLAGVVVDRPDAVSLGVGWVGVSIITCSGPWGSTSPAASASSSQVELVGVVEVIFWFEALAGFFDRLLLRAYSGSGLVMVCCGRLCTIPAAFRCTRTVSYSTRMPVCSAM